MVLVLHSFNFKPGTDELVRLTSAPVSKRNAMFESLTMASIPCSYVSYRQYVQYLLG